MNTLHTQAVKGKLYWLLAALPIVPMLMGTSSPGIAVNEAADVIVVVVPMSDMRLDIPSNAEREIHGDTVKEEKGKRAANFPIIHSKHTVIGQLRKGIPMRLFLKQIPGRDAYSLIGVHSVNAGGNQ